MEVDHPKTEEKLLGKKRKRDDSDDSGHSDPPSKRMVTETKDKYVCVSDLNR